MLTLGIDPGLNKVGYCLYGEGTATFWTSVSTASDHYPQFLKIYGQKMILRKLLAREEGKINYVGIEQPYVSGVGFRNSGGHQSANMWAVYSMLLEEIMDAHLPVLMINITQLHALIIRRRGITKTDIVKKAKEEILTETRMDQHQADAYFVAKSATHFWRLMDGQISLSDLTPDERDIFTSRRVSKKQNLSGIIWRAGDFWFDFRGANPTLHPKLESLKELCL